MATGRLHETPESSAGRSGKRDDVPHDRLMATVLACLELFMAYPRFVINNDLVDVVTGVCACMTSLNTQISETGGVPVGGEKVGAHWDLHTHLGTKKHPRTRTQTHHSAPVLVDCWQQPRRCWLAWSRWTS